MCIPGAETAVLPLLPDLFASQMSISAQHEPNWPVPEFGSVLLLVQFKMFACMRTNLR